MDDLGRDPITVLRIHMAADPPGRALFVLCHRSLAARLAAAAAGSADQVTDLGLGALLIAQAADRARDEFDWGTMLQVGVAEGGRWLWWYPPSPREPVPGTPGAAGQRN